MWGGRFGGGDASLPIYVIGMSRSVHHYDHGIGYLNVIGPHSVVSMT